VGPDQRLAAIAARQRGLVTRAQALAAGLTSDQIAHRLRTGRLHPVHRGVYAVGHPTLPALGRELAALLACGPGSVLSHLTAAVLWGLLPDDASAPVHVTATRRHRRAPSGVVLHRCALDPRDVHRRHDLPLTSPARTLELLPATAVDDAVDQARARRLLTGAQLEELRRTTRRPALRAAVGDDHGFTRSQAERRLRALLDRAGLPRPRTNARLHGHEVDAVWPEHRLVLEVDSWAHHSSRAAFERDRARDAAHAAAGYRVVRVTWRRLVDRPEAVAVELALALRPAEPTPRRG